MDIRKNNTNNIQVSTAIKTILFEELKNYISSKNNIKKSWIRRKNEKYNISS